ncbi:hypothetical protein FOPG_18945 [Fusarium oxysporum f. sp. conglutinans race 2 54008]|uniref:Uncharacterized protein n=1 Tax=Fusarium oxysporum f. sp. conglutinans race 2 54008 TaxID=1089457 RepID=X0GY55_FUSOX|nr:hypothetical protein FOPG_18945 [Fusarium oxysporum f. sp. conglutinans race 2 54008]
MEQAVLCESEDREAGHGKQAGRRRYNIYSGWRGLSTVIVELFGRRALL